ncbi:hypothetical protein QNI19_16495 [Cytophagaceae bacterium DM2B3-1]|uniref:Uncharacterized protein n=1 Tax=Xanthocytophaga flava TaxID=3048013 RepID=A0ABT7CLC6_9BACT|nr:hypothetical protein [Xanthocytophaga flavus]MDJ1494546.1 hypothetical protein [Xanthocytophaga flavus]
MSQEALEQLLSEIILVNPIGVKAVLSKYKITNAPSPRVLVLAIVKHGESFLNDLVSVAATVETLSFTGISTDILDKYGDKQTMAANVQTSIDNAAAEKAYAEQQAKQEKLKNIIWTGIQAVQTGVKYIQNSKNGTFTKEEESAYDIALKKKEEEENSKILGMPKYYFMAGAALLFLMIVFGVVIYLKKKKSK